MLTVILVVAMLTLTACSGGTEAPTTENNEQNVEAIILQLAFSAADSSPAGIQAEKVKELMEAKSEGRIKVDIYPNAQLGGDRELIESSQAGNIAMVTLTTAPMVTFIPELAVFDMPALLNDKEATKEVLAGEFGEEISQLYVDAGFELLMICPDSFRQMSSNIAVNSIEDFSGVKIRTMENKYHMAFWKALGANPSPLAFSELYIALQQGLVDAQENPYATLISAKLHEQQKYVINTNHIMFLNTTVMNKATFDGLPEDLQQIVQEVFEEVNEFGFELGNTEAEKAIKELKEAGLEIIDLPASEHEKIQELAQPVYEMVREDVGSELVDLLLAELEKVK